MPLLKTIKLLDLFPTPEYLLLASAGIVVNDTGVKLVAFSRGLFSNSLKLSKFEKIPLPDELVQEGFVNNSDKLVAILSDLASRHKLHYIYAALPEERAYIFTTTIDKVPQEGLRDAVAFVVEENAPVTLAESVFDFEVVEELKESNKIKVTVSVISKKVVDFYLQVFESAGMTPISFDIEAEATARAIIPRGDKGVRLIVNIGNKKTGLYIVEDGVVRFTTTLPYGIVSSDVGNIQSELSRVITFWNTHDGNRSVENMFLCGYGTLNESYLETFKNSCQIPCEVANVWANAPEVAVSLPQAFTQESLDHAAAIGLALPYKKTHV